MSVFVSLLFDNVFSWFFKLKTEILRNYLFKGTFEIVILTLEEKGILYVAKAFLEMGESDGDELFLQGCWDEVGGDEEAFH